MANLTYAPQLVAEGDACVVGIADAACLDARAAVHQMARRPSAETLDRIMRDLDEIAPGLAVARAAVQAAMQAARG